MKQLTPNIFSGDLFDHIPPPPYILAHVCNNVTKWGAGFTKALSAWNNEPEKMFLASPRLPLGSVQLVRLGPGAYVANMVAQNGTRSARNPVPLDYVALDVCLEQVAEWAYEFKRPALGYAGHTLVLSSVSSQDVTVVMPKIGSGLAGGDWGRILPLIESRLKGLRWEVWEKE